MLIKGDCLEEMLKIPEKSVDLLLADPPYNVSKPDNHLWGLKGRQGLDFGEWDKDFDVTSWIKIAAKTLKENSNVVIFNAWENLGAIKQECQKQHIMIKRCLVLSKANPAPFNRDRVFVSDVEFALWGVYNSKDKPTKWFFNRESPIEKCVIPTTVQSSKLHPTMKDLKVIEKLVRILCPRGGGSNGPFYGFWNYWSCVQKPEPRFYWNRN